MPKPQQLTATARLVLGYILKYKYDTGGASPSIREIGAACNLRSTSVVYYHLDCLQSAGAIERSSHTARSIRVIGETWNSPQRDTNV
ncbi:MAG TPA: hypothetical protein PKG95_07805 [Anaerolineaceae bacterium]|nr:hypothetical protein [Anaerolineaceae bacterium]